MRSVASQSTTLPKRSGCRSRGGGKWSWIGTRSKVRSARCAPPRSPLPGMLCLLGYLLPWFSRRVITGRARLLRGLLCGRKSTRWLIRSLTISCPWSILSWRAYVQAWITPTGSSCARRGLCLCGVDGPLVRLCGFWVACYPVPADSDNEHSEVEVLLALRLRL